MKLYREEEHEVILDVYSPARQCIPEGKPQILERLPGKKLFKMQACGQD